MSRKKGSPTGEYLSPLQFAETLDLCEETAYRLIARGPRSLWVICQTPTGTRGGRFVRSDAAFIEAVERFRLRNADETTWPQSVVEMASDAWLRAQRQRYR